MATKQLDTLLRFEKDNEQRCSDQLKIAENEYQQNLERLQGVADYRLEYMKRLSQRAEQGLDSATYTHYHSFIAKLDLASEQVEIAAQQAKALAEQCRELWLKQRQKVEAVELLRDKRLKKAQAIEDKREQAMFDEISTQQFIRRNVASS